MNIGYLNLASFVLGCIAWALPVFVMIRSKRNHGKRAEVFSILSAGACALTLYLQIVETNERVKVRDWSGIDDTFHALTTVAGILIVVTVILNLWMYAKVRKRNQNGG